MRRFLFSLLLLLALGCSDPGEKFPTKDAAPADGPGSDQKVKPDGPGSDQKAKPDGPQPDAKVMPDGPNQDQKVIPDGPSQDQKVISDGPQPDAAACPASKSVWGTMIWGNGCLWQ